jgi:hypothetical protein
VTERASDGNPAVTILPYPVRPTGTPPSKKITLDGMLMRLDYPHNYATDPDTGLRRCTFCREWKPLDQYGHDAKGSMQKAYLCRPCHRAYQRGYDTGRRYKNGDA